MIRHKLGRLVQWKEGDAHMVGKIVQFSEYIEHIFTTGNHYLVALAHTHELVSVESSKLSDYPSEPIPQPEPTK